MGSHLDDPVRLQLVQPQRTPEGWQGEVIHIDHFGNIATNILRKHLGPPRDLTVRLCGETIHGIVNTFGEKEAGNLVALYGSTGNLIVSVVNGDAAARLDARVGDPVEVEG
jgi:S-adenosylmethionine hydrolase